MAEHHKIHPVDVEAPTSPPPPTAPPAPLSDKPPPQPLLPPPQPLPQPRRRRRSRLCRCLCWTLLAFVILIVLVGATIGILYLVFHPKIPKYSLDDLEVASIAVLNTTAAATFNLTITARNPNKKIGIYYQGGSSLNAWYKDTKICSGSLPVFYQGHRNTTVMSVLLSGETELGVVSDLQAEAASGPVALQLKGRVPVRIKMGKLKLRKMTFRVRCNLLVDNLTSSSSVRIKSSSCKFRLKL